jgi:hypothetical protein
VIKMKSKLTAIFSQLAAVDETKESLGAQILAFLVEAECRTLDQANEQFGIAYHQNGWARTAGRPRGNVQEVKAPATVQIYVSTFRRAYKAGMDVLAFQTVGEMRKALKDLSESEKQGQQEKPAALVGVQVSREDRITGALVHDISVVLTHLPESQRDEFEVKLQKLLAQYMKKAPAELKLVA